MNVKPSWIKLKETLKNSYTSYLPNNILLDDNLHHSSKTVYAIINAMCFNKNNEMTDTVYPSQALIAYLSNLSTKSISRGIQELEKFGYIQVVRNKGFVNKYTVVARFAQRVFNKIKKKASEVKDAVKGKKNNKQPKESNWNYENQRDYGDYIDLEKRLLQRSYEVLEDLDGTPYQQMCLT